MTLLRVLLYPVLLASAAVSASAQGSVQRAGEGPPPSSTKADAYPVVSGALELELRHAGGPRREVLVGLIKSLDASRHPSWGGAVLGACKDGLIDCADYVAIAEERLPRMRSDYPERAEADIQAIRRRAFLQGLSRAQQESLFRRALNTKGIVVEGPIKIRGSEDAALWILRERMYDLIPEIERASRRWVSPPTQSIRAQILVGQACVSTDPGATLLALIRDGVEHDVALQIASTDPMVAFVPCTDLACSAGLLAIPELRRLNPPGVVKELEAILDLYQPVRDKKEQEWLKRVEGAERNHHPVDYSSKPSEISFLGSLGSSVAELVGDLGDRARERQALGGRCLWDRVHEAEREMVRKGLLRAGEMVTGEEH